MLAYLAAFNGILQQSSRAVALGSQYLLTVDAEPTSEKPDQMTPDAIRQAIYELSQAAATQSEAELSGANLGRMLANQFKAQGSARKMLHSASKAEIGRLLINLRKNGGEYQARVAQSAFLTWSREMTLSNI